MAKLVFVTDDVAVDPDEVTSIQKEEVHEYSSPSISDSSTYLKFTGSVMTLKNGRKIYIPSLYPKDIQALLDIAAIKL